MQAQQAQTLLQKLKQIKATTQELMEGGETNAEATTNATADQEQPKQAI